MNSYAAASENTPVNFVNSVDFPTEGNPTNPTRQSPVLVTSKPSPLGPPFGPAASINSRCNFASLARSDPKCVAVALFFCVRLISSSIAAIFSKTESDMMPMDGSRPAPFAPLGGLYRAPRARVRSEHKRFRRSSASVSRRASRARV